MSNEDLNQLKDILNIYLTAHSAEFKSRFDFIELKLDQTNEYLKIQNGRVSKNEEKLNNALKERDENRINQKNEIDNQKKDLERHIITCPQLKRIEQLEQEQTTKKDIRKWVVSTITLISVVIGIIIGLLKLYQS